MEKSNIIILYMEDRIIFQLGRKTFDVFRIHEKDRVVFRLVERSRGRPFEAFLSFHEFIWVCDWMGRFSSSSGPCWKKRIERFREVTVSKEKNAAGQFIRIIVRGTGRSGMICFPDLGAEVGWGMVAERMSRFTRGSKTEGKKSPRTYKVAAEIPPWPDLVECSNIAGKNSDVDFQIEESSFLGALSFLERSWW